MQTGLRGLYSRPWRMPIVWAQTPCSVHTGGIMDYWRVYESKRMGQRKGPKALEAHVNSIRMHQWIPNQHPRAQHTLSLGDFQPSPLSRQKSPLTTMKAQTPRAIAYLDRHVPLYRDPNLISFNFYLTRPNLRL